MTAGVPEEPDSWRGWVRTHDDRWSFVLVYVSLAVGLSIVLGLFWLLIVGALHWIIEVVRQRDLGWAPAKAPLIALWEVRLDLVLFVFALALAVYVDVIFGVLGLGSVASATARAGSRASLWQHLIRTAATTADDAVHVGRALMKRNGDAGEGELHLEQTRERLLPGWQSPWTAGTRITVGAGLLFVVLIAVAPWWTGLGVEGVLHLLVQELHPFAAFRS